MPPQQTRRRYLAGAGLAGLTGLAGCSAELRDAVSDDDGGDTPETTESSDDSEGTTVPSWAGWIPAEPVASGTANALALDIRKARSEYPQSAYEELQIPRLAEVYGIDQSDMDYFCGRSPPVGDGVWVLTGTFDPAAVLSNLGVDESETGSYRGYSVIEELAIGPEALVVSDYRRTLDTRFGDTTGLEAAGPDWELLLSAVSDGTLVNVQTGFFEDTTLSFSVRASGLEINAARSGGASIVAHLLFASEDRAVEVLENNEGEIRADAVGEDGDVESLERRGRRLVMRVETDTFEFDDGLGGRSRL